MRLLIDDDNVSAKLSGLSDGRRRLTIDYPREGGYEGIVRTALRELLRPKGFAEPTRRAKRDMQTPNQEQAA